MIVTGLRGVGKTVLLDVFREKAEACDWATVEWEVEKDAAFAPKMAAHVRRALLQIAPKAKWTDRVLRAASVLKSFTITFNPDGAMTAGLDIDALAGIGDSGALSEDLTDLFAAIGEAAQDRGVGVVFLNDEIQFLRPADLEVLIVALHKSQISEPGIPAGATARGAMVVYQGLTSTGSPSPTRRRPPPPRALLHTAPDVGAAPVRPRLGGEPT